MPERGERMTKDEYIAFLESENKRYYSEIQQLTFEKGFLRGRLMEIYERNPRLGMTVIKGGKYYELAQKGGVR
jgi:hypothetical protein